MNHIKYLLIIISIVLLSSCEGLLYPCLEGNGKTVEETRAVSSFAGIINTTEFDVQVVYDQTSSSLTVEADENLQQYIKTYVQDNNLVVETEQGRCLESGNRIHIIVRCPQINKVVLSGSGDVDIYDYQVDFFSATNTGSGDIDLNNLVISTQAVFKLTGSGDIAAEGKAKEADMVLSGSGDIDADRFTVSGCGVTLSGSGNISVTPLVNLTGLLSGSGSIFYYGDPGNVNVRVTGSGKLIKE